MNIDISYVVAVPFKIKIYKLNEEHLPFAYPHTSIKGSCCQDQSVIIYTFFCCSHWLNLDLPLSSVYVIDIFFKDSS